MKFFIIFVFLLSACTLNKNDRTNLFDNKDIFSMTIEKYKEMLIDYNLNKDYPNIDN